jgi:hypothetical protein
VTRVDHLYARVEDPKAAFVALTEQLGLPRSYGFSRVPGFEGAAVSLGNVVFLEVLRYAPGRRVRLPANPGLDGLALECALGVTAAADELSRRGIPHSPPISYAGDPAPFAFGNPLQRGDLRDGPGPLWSMVVLGGFLGDQTRARQFRLIPSRGTSRVARALGTLQGRLMSSEQFGDLVMAKTMTAHPTVWLHRFEAADMRKANAAAADELAASGGGSLGLQRVRDVVLGACDAAAETERWQRLLDPHNRDTNGAWQLGDGPALRLVQDQADRIQALVCEVSSLDRAAAFLARERMLSKVTEDAVQISPPSLQGIDIRLVEAAAPATEAPATLNRRRSPR